jgi:hypothetical protein
MYATSSNLNERISKWEIWIGSKKAGSMYLSLGCMKTRFVLVIIRILNIFEGTEPVSTPWQIFKRGFSENIYACIEKKEAVCATYMVQYTFQGDSKLQLSLNKTVS